MLPGVDGWALTQAARREGIATPILIVSARGSEHDKVHALEIGADDYLAKPFGMRELVARTQALLRRTRTRARCERVAGADRRTRASTSIPSGRRAFLLAAGGERIDADFTPTEFRLLLTLARQPGRVLDRDELQQRVWNVPYRSRDRSVDVCVRKLREKLIGTTRSAVAPAPTSSSRGTPATGRKIAGRTRTATTTDLAASPTRTAAPTGLPSVSASGAPPTRLAR